MAVIFLTKMDGSNNISNEGLCLKCAKELGVQPINEMMEKMGLTDEAIDAMDDQLDQLGENAFEMGGAQSMPPFFQQLLFLARQFFPKRKKFRYLHGDSFFPV